MNNQTTTLEPALEILAAELNRFNLRKYTALGGSGYSQLERDIVEKLTNWQKEQDEAKYKALLESHNELLDNINIIYQLLDNNSLNPLNTSEMNDLINLINKAKKIKHI